MAQKKITDLQLADAVTDDLNFPSDDTIQSYRVTAAQVLAYVLAAGNVGTSAIASLAVTAAKLAADAIETSKILDANVTRPKLAVAERMPIGTVLSFAGTSAPTGYLLCDGLPVSRSTYSDLFAIVGESYGEGDNSTTFNLPDLRYKFVRGLGPNTTVTGSGTAGSNNATFTSHGFTRTGLKVRKASGTLSGLSASLDYWVIVIDANTLAFATSLANAKAATKIAISGANSAVIIQNEDPDLFLRAATQAGGNSGANVGSEQDDAMQGHFHELKTHPWNGGGQIAPYATGASGTPSELYATDMIVGNAKTDASNGTPRMSCETRPKNIYMNYIIKY